MYRKKETEFQYPPVIESILEDVIGGGTIARADIVGVATELPPGVVVAKEQSGLYRVLKTAKVVGGTVSEPRIAKNHLFKVGESVYDGTDTVKIASIAAGEEYDTLAFVEGALSSLVEVLVLARDTSNADAVVVLEGGATQNLTIKFPSAEGVEDFNGIEVELVQAADDTLALSYAEGKIVIALANATASKNNAAAIQTALRQLVIPGLDLSGATASAGTGWNGNQTGATLTTPLGTVSGGAYEASGMKYAPTAITLSKVDVTVANQSSGLLARGSVNERALPYPVNESIKAALRHIRFV